MSAPQNVLQLSVHLASTLLDVTVGFLERLLSGELTGEVLHSLGSSFLFSTLLPTTLAQLGPVACKQAKVGTCSRGLLTLVQLTLNKCQLLLTYINGISTLVCSGGAGPC